MPRGTVKFFNTQKGYGFIAQEEGEDIFVHYSNIGGSGFKNLEEGQEVEFEIGEGRKGAEALDVRAVWPMASKGRESWDKRQRERTKKDRQAAKRADRAERKNTEEEESGLEVTSEAELYERFAKLSASHANGEVDDETFEERKEEIFELLGLELHS